MSMRVICRAVVPNFSPRLWQAQDLLHSYSCARRKASTISCSLPLSGWAPSKRADEGDWNFSPEWWGTQGDGWGDNNGEVVFGKFSRMGNGEVSVTAHPASTPKPKSAEWWFEEEELERRCLRSGKVAKHKILGFEWRVLRFNKVTRQSVTKVMVCQSSKMDKQFLIQRDRCIAFGYGKSMVSAGLAAVSLAGVDMDLIVKGVNSMRILCIGLGGGSLPLFLAHNLKGALVDVVEIDPTVIEAATTAMGFPTPCILTGNSLSRAVCEEESIVWHDVLGKLSVIEADGEAYVCGKDISKEKPHYYDMVFIDAYDGDDNVPIPFWDRNGKFMHALEGLLHPRHGTAIVNLHTDSPLPDVFERITGQFRPGFDPALPQGAMVQEACLAYRDVLFKNKVQTSNLGTSVDGLAFTVAVPSQQNICLVACKGSFEIEPDRYTKNKEELLPKQITRKLVFEAGYIENLLNIDINMAKRVVRGFKIV